MSSWQVYKRLLGYLKPLWFVFALSILGNAIFAMASALMAAAMEPVVEAIQNPTQSYRALVPLLIIGVFALRGIGFFLRSEERRVGKEGRARWWLCQSK